MNPFVLINGIRAEPDDMFTWTDRAERWLQLEYGITAEKIEYKIGAFRRPSRLKELSANLAKVIYAYNLKGHRPNVMAHSNGNVLVCRALDKHPGIKIDTLHMVMPACWSSMERNGLNKSLARGSVRRIVCYGSDNDKVVEWGKRTGILRKLGLPVGYGGASHDGLIEIAPEVADRVTNVRKNDWGHSTFGQYDVLPKFIRDDILARLRE